MLHDVYFKNKGFQHPIGYLFCSSFLIKTKELTLFWDESNHYTSIYHKSKKNDNTTLQLTS